MSNCTKSNRDNMKIYNGDVSNNLHLAEEYQNGNIGGDDFIRSIALNTIEGIESGTNVPSYINLDTYRSKDGHCSVKEGREYGKKLAEREHIDDINIAEEFLTEIKNRLETKKLIKGGETLEECEPIIKKIMGEINEAYDESLDGFIGNKVGLDKEFIGFYLGGFHETLTGLGILKASDQIKTCYACTDKKCKYYHSLKDKIDDTLVKDILNKTSKQMNDIKTFNDKF